MIAEKVDLTGAKATLLATLYGRALDSKARSPILGDTYAADLVQKIDFDFRKTKMTRRSGAAVALRARLLDRWTSEFIAGHPRSIIVHLGCGLDSRVYRVDPPAGVRWYDIDYPEIIELRRRLYPPREGYQMIGSSVTAPRWPDDIPADAPVMIVAEGLMMYLTEGDGRRLIQSLTDHFPSGEIAFDALSRLGIRLQKLIRPVQAAGATLHWGISDPGELQRWNPRLSRVTSMSAFKLPGYERLPWTYRTLARICAHTPKLSNAARFLRYRW